mgnify:CR=1 FL=1
MLTSPLFLHDWYLINNNMKLDDLNEKSFLLYAMKEYNNPQCVDIDEFNRYDASYLYFVRAVSHTDRDLIRLRI